MANSEYDLLIKLAERVEKIITTLGDSSELLKTYQNSIIDEEVPYRRAWADVAPAAALRRFGDCKDVLILATRAEKDLIEMLDSNLFQYPDTPIDDVGT